MSKTTESNQTSTSNATQTPTNPDWVTQPLQSDVSNIMALSNVPASSYVAPQTALQLQANQQGADTLSGTNPNYGAASAGFSGNSSINAGDISGFLSPYLSQVLGTTNQALDQGAGVQNANLEAQAAASGAFGGSRFGVAQGVLGGQQQLAKGQADANIENTGYQSAVSDALNNATLGQNAATGLLNVGNGENASNVANIAELANLGGAQQATAQAQAAAPIALAQAQTGLLAGLPLNMYTGQDATGSSNTSGSSTTTDPMAMISALAGLAGAGLTGGASLAGMFAPLGSAGGGMMAGLM